MSARPFDIRQAVVRRRDACVQFRDGQPARDRKEALQFYNGTNLTLYGDSGDGLSKVVSRDTMEAVESVMPPLLEPFVAGEEVVSFDPTEKDDTDSAKQATDYVNNVFRRHNNVLQVAQSALKDGLLFRMGVAKTVMEEVEEGAPQQFDGVTPEELATIDPAQIAGETVQDPITGLHSFTMAPPKVPKFRVYIIAPDEFLYDERLAALEDATFLGHSRANVAVGDLIAMGIDPAKAKALRASNSTDVQNERFSDERDDFPSELPTDDLARLVQVDECYIRCDYDGTGVLQWRKVLLGGSDSALLSDEPVDDHPYSVWTPIPIPHKLVGLSMHDLTKDVQMQKTAITREALNATYLLNRPQRAVVEGQANVDDLMQPALAGIVRVKSQGAVENIPTGGENILATALQFIEYLDALREARTGVTRYNQGMDANSLNKTATGMNIIASNSQQRQRLVARQFGEFLKDVFEKLLGLVANHAQPEEVSRVTGKPFVTWPTQYDTTVSVGLGNNNKDQLVGHLMQLLQLDQAIITLQQGVNGPILTAENVYAKLRRLPEAMGFKDNDFYTDPADQQQAQQPQQPPGPSPDAQLKAQTELQKTDMQQHGAVARETIKQQAETHRAQPTVVPFPVPMEANNG